MKEVRVSARCEPEYNCRVAPRKSDCDTLAWEVKAIVDGLATGDSGGQANHRNVHWGVSITIRKRSLNAERIVNLSPRRLLYLKIGRQEVEGGVEFRDLLQKLLYVKLTGWGYSKVSAKRNNKTLANKAVSIDVSGEYLRSEWDPG
jgi:hypothetical protein